MAVTSGEPRRENRDDHKVDRENRKEREGDKGYFIRAGRQEVGVSEESGLGQVAPHSFTNAAG